jgi:hypothetical protein
LASLPENPELDWAKNRRDPKDAIRIVRRFSEFCNKTLTQLLELQTRALTSTDIDERDSVLILAEKFIENFKGRRTTKLLLLSNIRSFFEFHRRPLPPTRKTWLKNLKNDNPKVEGAISPDELQTIVRTVSGDPRKQSMFLVQLQSFSGPRELRIIDNTMGVFISEQLKAGANLIDLYFREGRKHSENPWHTYIGREACDALRKWFEVRGYPTKESPYIWPSLKPQTLGQGLTESGARQTFDRVVSRLGMRPKIGSGRKTDRYGKSIKELRDLALSFSQQAVGKENELGEPFQESSAEYFAGHTIDELGYRKIHDLDAEYRKRQYQLVEPFLSPISGNNHIRTRLEEANIRITEIERGYQEKIKELDDKISELKATIGTMVNPANATEAEQRILIDEMIKEARSRKAAIRKKRVTKGTV